MDVYCGKGSESRPRRRTLLLYQLDSFYIKLILGYVDNWLANGHKLYFL